MPAPQVITRRNLPHWYVTGATHFITYRLAGTIPAIVLQEMREQREARLQGRPPPGTDAASLREIVFKQHFADYDRYLDQHRAIDWLVRPDIAALVRANLYHHAGRKYHLLAYCIMPNHVHVLIQPNTEAERPAALGDERGDQASPLADIMHSLKSYTAKQANQRLGRSGSFWQDESYDHWVRDDDELERIVAYITFNPVKAGLVAEPHLWFFSSAHDRFLQDGSTCGWLLPAGGSAPSS